MELALRVFRALILLIFVIAPICVAIGALVIHLWRRIRKGATDKADTTPPPGRQR